MNAAPSSSQTADRVRLRLEVRGAVQGVGFRPFVYTLAEELGLGGWVRNSPCGVTIELEGAPADTGEFCLRLRNEPPPRSAIYGIETQQLAATGGAVFEIRESIRNGKMRAIVLPDIATCAACRAEIFDPRNRRHRYPFTNCTHCGPRYSILHALPYDRENTSMRGFAMCAACRAEYRNPTNLRFHAQPNACPRCGPQLEWRDAGGRTLRRRDEALAAAVAALRAGATVAIKGLGGFHLFVDARNEAAVRRLRARKGREEKPFAVMFPGITDVRAACELTPLEDALLTAPEAPIVLLRRRAAAPICEAVAPRNPQLGALLPYTPLHHLLLTELGFPVVATSGNVSGEPICIDEGEAQVRLAEIADFFLVHDRPIVRHVDDSVVRVMAGREMLLRRARGFAPLPIFLPEATPPVLALGAQQKNAVALAVGAEVFVSQHIGDLSEVKTVETLRAVAADLQRLYHVRPAQLVIDEHPDYATTRLAPEFGVPAATLQHHCAHVLACMAEHQLRGPVLGVAWDGTGFGTDGTIWGGEFLRVTADGFAREAHLRTFRLPGGEAAAREPRRSALGVLYELFAEAAFRRQHLPPMRSFKAAARVALKSMLRSGTNCPRTSSAGRLFDAVASILDLRQCGSFEGQAAMELEFALGDHETDEAYEMPLAADGVVDWGPALRAIVAERRKPAWLVSARFHNALVEAIVAVARRVGEMRVVLTGGCFQNRYLTERAIRRLREAGFHPCWHQRVPPNDGGIALGQAAAAAHAATLEEPAATA